MLKNQTYASWSLIAVDDACPEQTGRAIENLLPSAHVIRLDRNGGAARARNVGVQASDAPFVALLDQDDLWHPSKLAKQVAVLTTRPAVGACGTDALLIDGDGAEIGEAESNAKRREVDWESDSLDELLRAQFLSNRVKTSSSLVRRTAWDDVGGQDERNPGAEDWKLWLDMLARGWRIAQVLEPLHLWRQHADNVSKDLSRDRRRKQLQVVYGFRHARRLGVRTLALAARRALS